MDKKKAVVTGGAGFIGSHLVRGLLERGYEVHSVDNFSAGLFEHRFHEGAVYHKMDIRTGDCKKAFEGAEYVFHAAALPRVQLSIENPLSTHETNITGTLNVLLAAKSVGVKKLVYSASSSAYGDQPVLPLSEDMRASPKSPYGLHKFVGEEYCRVFTEVYGLPTVSLRYFNVYGPGADPHGAYALVIAKFIEQRKRGESMTVAGDGENTRDYTHVHDVVRANILAAESQNVGKAEVVNIGAGNNVSVNRVAQLIGGPVETVEARPEPKDTRADNKRARELLDWGPTISIEDGIAELKKLEGLA